MKKTIAVIYGGRSGEHEVSLVSAASIARNLDPTKYAVLLVGITQDGEWYLQSEDELERCRAGAQALGIKPDPARRVAVVPGGGVAGGLIHLGTGIEPNIPRQLRVDIVFPVLHGTFGEDGTIQGLFEMAGLPYIGSGVLGSAVGMDKDVAKALWLQAGLPTTAYIAVRANEWMDHDRRGACMEKAERDFRYPLFVKPSCAGSSVGAGKAASRQALESAIAEAFRWDDKILIEPFVPAREIECSVTGNTILDVYDPGEVTPTHEFYDYDAKYVDAKGASFNIPANIDGEQLKKVQEIAEAAYRVAELSGLARVDFFIRKDTGEILLNEVNTMPGFTTISMFPKMCEASGLAYGALLNRLVELAEKRHAARGARNYTRVSGEHKSG